MYQDSRLNSIAGGGSISISIHMATLVLMAGGTGAGYNIIGEERAFNAHHGHGNHHPICTKTYPFIHPKHLFTYTALTTVQTLLLKNKTKQNKRIFQI